MYTGIRLAISIVATLFASSLQQGKPLTMNHLLCFTFYEYF